MEIDEKKRRKMKRKVTQTKEVFEVASSIRQKASANGG
jgi:hypothetical protein